MLLSYFPDSKDPNAQVFYRFDFSREFKAVGHTLGSSDIVVVSSPESTSDVVLAPEITISNIMNDPTGLVTFWVAGGVVDSVYWIRCRVFGALLTPVQYTNDRTVGLRVEHL